MHSIMPIAWQTEKRAQVPRNDLKNSSEKMLNGIAFAELVYILKPRGVLLEQRPIFKIAVMENLTYAWVFSFYHFNYAR